MNNPLKGWVFLQVRLRRTGNGTKKTIDILIVHKNLTFTNFNVYLNIMLFPEDEQPASLARLGSTPIVLIRQVFPQVRSVVLQLGLANNPIWST